VHPRKRAASAAGTFRGAAHAALDVRTLRLAHLNLVNHIRIRSNHSENTADRQRRCKTPSIAAHFLARCGAASTGGNDCFLIQPQTPRNLAQDASVSR